MNRIQAIIVLILSAYTAAMITVIGLALVLM